MTGDLAHEPQVYGIHVLSDGLAQMGVLQAAVLMGSRDAALKLVSRVRLAAAACWLPADCLQQRWPARAMALVRAAQQSPACGCLCYHVQSGRHRAGLHGQAQELQDVSLRFPICPVCRPPCAGAASWRSNMLPALWL